MVFVHVGKTAPRLIADLLDYDVRKSAKTGNHILIDPAPIHEEPGDNQRLNNLRCHHQLYKKESQSATLNPNQEPDPTIICKIAAYCSKCRYHFQITVNFQDWKDGQTPCNTKDPENPLHHFRVVDSKYTKGQEDSKEVYTLVEHQFACTAATCPVKVQVKIVPPRLSADKIPILTNRQDTQARGQREIEAEPERFEGHRPLYPLQVLSNLRSYLRDAARGTGKPIAARNKRFRLAFGDDCDNLLNDLGFNLKLEQSSDPEVCILLSYYDYTLSFRI